MADGTSDTVLAFDGEIYNFKETRTELECKGYKFRSKGDTEVLLQLLNSVQSQFGIDKLTFRPFVPLVIREAVREWFEVDDDVPFMLKVYPVRSEKREKIPAVTQVDGSGRLQTVHEHTNPRFYRLIKWFAAKTVIPILLNTSFNENDP